MDSSFLANMGNRIYLRRKEQNLTQEALADMIGVSVQTISNIECGKKAARPENLANICRALNISSDYILLGIRSADQTNELVKAIAALPDDQYNALLSLIYTLI